jgi:tRNA A-37 threonylcarbamoyl transferase component Bud32
MSDNEWEDNKKVVICKESKKAIKFYKNVPYDYVAENAKRQQYLFDAGLPVPEVYGVRKISETETALDMAYIESKPFTHDNMGKDEQVNALTVMAKLQSMIYKVDASGFPRLSDYFAKEIKSTPYLTAQIKDKAVDLLYKLDTGKTNLCHGDFHPGNIIFDGEKYWVIDWEEPSRGDPAADACMTYFYEKRFAPPGWSEIYLRMFCEESKIKQEDVLAWLPVIATYQVNIETKDQREFILKIIKECYE